MIAIVSIGAGFGFGLPLLANWVMQGKGIEPVRGQQLQLSQMVMLFLCTILLSVAYYVLSFSFELVIAIGFLFFLGLVSFTDWWRGLILNRFTYPAFFLFFFVLWLDSANRIPGLLGAGIAGIGLYALARYTGGIGIGDSKLMAVTGLVVGWPSVLFALWLATLSAIMYWLILWLKQKGSSWTTPLPFAPHLALGSYITYLWGDQIFLTLLVLSPL